MYQLKILLDQLPTSLNKKLKWGAKYKNVRENRSWDWIIKCHCASRLPSQPLPKAKIRITRHAWRMLDYDGLVGSLKPVVDSLVSCGVLQDDSWGVVGQWEVDQKFRPKSAGPLLEIVVESQS